MPDSAPSAIVTATSPAKPVFDPAPPAIESAAFVDPNSLVASLVITMPAANTNGDPLAAGSLVNIKVFFGPSGTDLSGVTPLEFPGAYDPASKQTVQVNVPVWAEAYDFEAEVSD